MERVGDLWYRFEDYISAPMVDEWELPMGPPTVHVRLRTYKVEKVTPCGVRFLDGRFVNRSHRKKYAYPTEAQAKVAFLHRKKRQLEIMRSRIEQVEGAIAIIEGRSRPWNLQIPVSGAIIGT